MILGIDIGASCALALIPFQREPIEVFDMPYLGDGAKGRKTRDDGRAEATKGSP